MDEEDDDEPTSGIAQDGASKKKKPKKKKKKGKDNHEATGEAGAAGAGAPPMGALGQPLAPIAEEEWVDISDVVNLAAEGMFLGEMLESPQFRLYDAMSAIEIMDPKMDSGFNSGADMTLDRAEAEDVVSRSLTHEQMITVWDHLLMYYLLWLDGHTIVQTIFSCLYLQDPQRYVATMPIFGAFVDAFLVACRAARSAVLRANIFDDEDFLPNLFGVDLDACCAFSTKTSEVFESLTRHRKALAKEGGKSGTSPASRAARRMEWMGDYMMALAALSREGGIDDKARAAARRHIEACQRVVEQLRAEAENGGAAADDCAGALRCFDASLNRKLLVPGPPRTVEPIKDRAAVLKRLTSHLSELLLSVDVHQLPLAKVLDGAITCKGEPEPNVLPRSIVHSSLTDRSGHLRWLLLDSLEACLFPADALTHCKKAAEAFLAHCESVFSHTLRLANASRARRFRRLAHYFADFNALQHEAWQLDEELKRTFASNLHYHRPCWVWVMEQCLNAMISKLFLGFDLDLYDEAEFHMIYWYIDYLFGLRIYNSNELCHAKEQMVASSGNKKKPSAARQQEKGAASRGQRPRNPPPFLLHLEATQATVRGLFRLLAFCQRHDLTSAPRAASAGLAQRFVLRFRSLEHFRLPHLPSFKDFELSSASALAPVEGRAVLDAAKASLTDAAALLERISSSKVQEDEAGRISEETTALKRVVVANQLAVAELSRMLDSGKMQKVVATTSDHPYLVTVLPPSRQVQKAVAPSK
mmetsp:Transcript_23644/g.67858  ORF Transcript_23644/g.67858 Transcript_23644/m.67858 type:complete len:757 (-) Transcript_23644:64-2334(-)